MPGIIDEKILRDSGLIRTMARAQDRAAFAIQLCCRGGMDDDVAQLLIAADDVLRGHLNSWLRVYSDQLADKRDEGG